MPLTKRLVLADVLMRLKRDAARYRWLRDRADRDDSGHPYVALDNWLCEDGDDCESEITTSWLRRAEVDHAIDDARLRERIARKTKS